MRRLALLSLPLLSVGCFQTYGSCGELSRTEVAMDEVTDAGTASDLLAMVGMHDTFPAIYPEEDYLLGLDLSIEQDGPPVWIEQEEITVKTRTFNLFTRESALLNPVCSSHLDLPLVATATTDDGAVDVVVDGLAQMADPDTHWNPGVPTVELTGPYEGNEVPATDEDPARWTDKYVYIALDLDEEGLLGGSIGWGGEQQTDDSSSAVIDEALTFFADEEMPEPSEH